MIKCKLCMNIHFLHCVPTERFLYGYYFYTHNVPMERVHHNSFSCELSRKATNNFYNLGIYSKENKSSSTKFGNVTFKFGSASIARFMAKIAPSFLAQLLREIPLFTSQKSIDFNLRSASTEPSNNIPKPPLITSPQPTPPPL